MHLSFEKSHVVFEIVFTLRTKGIYNDNFIIQPPTKRVVLPFEPKAATTKCIFHLKKSHVVFEIVLPFELRAFTTTIILYD